MAEIQKISFSLCPRSCPLCQGGRLKPIWEYEHIQRTRRLEFVWSVRNVICERCGFGFVSPAPAENELATYYADAFPLSGEGYFSSEARMAVLGRFAGTSADKRIVEVGSNSAGHFLSCLQAAFKHVVSVELNNSCEPDARRTCDVANTSADIVASYFVLEHVPDVRGFLLECRRMVHENGVVVIEVPNVHLYPKMIAALDFHEHVNHFSPLTLQWLAAQCGLELIEISHHECSRPFGFVAVFRPAAARAYDESWTERSNSLACFAAGMELVHAKRRELEEYRAFLRAAVSSGKRAVIWAANDTCRKLLEGLSSEGLTVVDHDRAKSGFLAHVSVHHPTEVRDEIHKADIFVICTAIHARKISDYFEQIGIDLKSKDVRVIAL